MIASVPMDVLDNAAAAARNPEPASGNVASSGAAFLEELTQQLQAAGTVEALEAILPHARSLWAPTIDGHQALFDSVCWDVLRVLAPFAIRSRGCHAVLADTSRDIAHSCAPREAVTILLAAMSSADENAAADAGVTWGLRLAAVQGLKEALPLVPRRRLETFRQAAPALLAGLREARESEHASLADAEGDGKVAAWAVEQYPGAVVALAEALCGSLQPGEAQLQTALGRFILHVLSVSTSEQPFATPLSPGSAELAVSPLLLSLLPLFPPTGLTLERILSLDPEEEPPGTSLYDSGEGGDDEMVHAEEEQGRALAAACLLCLPASLLPFPLPALSGRDHASAVSLAGVLLRSPPAVATKGLALISATAARARGREHEELEATLVDGVQATLQSLTMLMLLQPDPRARQAAYAAFRAGLSVLSPLARFATLDFFIATCPHQPLVAVLLLLVKEEVAAVLPLPSATPPAAHVRLPPHDVFPGERILALVGRVLAPAGREGDPTPALPEEADVVVAALNLYRFVLLREAAVGMSWTGALSAASLEHARLRWLLPLRHVAAEAAAASAAARSTATCGRPSGEAGTHGGQSSGGRCGSTEMVVDTVAEVVHRVLEIVEERLQERSAADDRPPG